MKWTRLFSVVALCLFCLTQVFSQIARGNSASVSPLREMRGVWVASMANIDWPSAPGLSEQQLKDEAVTILDRTKKMGLNTIFLQVRPSADAIYKSSIEPMSSFVLSNPNDEICFDPLVFWIQEAHLRGLELHAWINPFRVTPKPDFVCSDYHLSKTHPEWTVTYAGKMYIDPGIPQARDYIVGVIADIVKRYDVDGIHFDDYFYPYPVAGEVFHDESSYASNNDSQLPLSDWRRNNVSNLIHMVYDTISSIKPWVDFGVSPFGVWRNKRDDSRGSDTRAGTTDYDVLYADVLLWAQKGWVDYLIPQIYWNSGNKAADFDTLYRWWGSVLRDTQVKLYIGHALHKVNTSSWPDQNEMPLQLRKVRQDTSLLGSVLFSYRQFNRDLFGLEQFLSDEFYTSRSLSPLNQNVSFSPDSVLEISKINYKSNVLSWHVVDENAVRFYVVYRSPKGHLENEEVFDVVGTNSYALPDNAKRRKYFFRVSSVDFFGHEGPKSSVKSVKY